MSYQLSEQDKQKLSNEGYYSPVIEAAINLLSVIPASEHRKRMEELRERCSENAVGWYIDSTGFSSALKLKAAVLATLIETEPVGPFGCKCWETHGIKFQFHRHNSTGGVILLAPMPNSASFAERNEWREHEHGRSKANGSKFCCWCPLWIYLRTCGTGVRLEA